MVGRTMRAIDRGARRAGAILVASILLAAVVACGDDGLSPGDLDVRYELATVNGEPVPYLWTDGEFTDEWLEAAALTLRNGEFQYVVTWWTTYASGAPDSRVTHEQRGTYRLVRGGLQLLEDETWWADVVIRDGALFLTGENFVEHRFER
jgi:hypothetical protein